MLPPAQPAPRWPPGSLSGTTGPVPPLPTATATALCWSTDRGSSGWWELVRVGRSPAEKGAEAGGGQRQRRVWVQALGLEPGWGRLDVTDITLPGAHTPGAATWLRNSVTKATAKNLSPGEPSAAGVYKGLGAGSWGTG